MCPYSRHRTQKALKILLLTTVEEKARSAFRFGDGALAASVLEPGYSCRAEGSNTEVSDWGSQQQSIPLINCARFISKASISRSPSRGRSSGSPQALKPLSPCLVHRSPSSSPNIPYKPVRRTSQPIFTQERKHDTAVTIPLRECCPDCAPVTEESCMEGDRWTEKFSRAARRRRSASLDNTGNAFHYSEADNNEHI
jgi:hypothetical protein